MITILTEKPSAAKNFAAALGGKKGTYNGERFEIVNALGHMLELKDPKNQVAKELSEVYRIWDMDALPWKYDDFAWKKELIRTKGYKEIMDSISASLKNADEAVIATDVDPSGEGEMLAFEILLHLGWKGKVSRMYFPDESPKSIQKAFAERQKLSADPMKDGDYVKAITRQRWDYMSMQWTRVATCVAGTCGYRRILRQGRLKSVMVSLVGDQEDAINNYVKKPYYEVRFKDENGNVYAVKKEDAARVSEKDMLDLSAYKRSDVVVTSSETKRKAPGKLLDLAGMSAALASKGYKPKRILDVYQKMYEDHVVSYPRTEDKKITPEQLSELLPLADKIARVTGVQVELLTHRSARKTHVDEKAGAHGANRPGVNVPQSLAYLKEKYGDEAPAIYELLAKSFLAMFAEDYVFEQQKGYVKDYPEYKGTANVPVSMGYRKVFDDTDTPEDAKPLGDTAEPFIHEGANKKPEKPTIKWLTKRLEKFNVGTGATRTSTIADITRPDAKTGLMNEKKGVLSLTENGKMSHCLLSGCSIASAEVTEKLFDAMQMIGRFEKRPQEMLYGIDQLIIGDKDVMLKNREEFIKRFGQGEETNGPAKKEEGTYIPTGERISFKRTWGTYTFTDSELQKLLLGEEIEIEYKDKDGKGRKIRGSFGENKYKGNKYWGFIKTSDDAYITGLFVPTGETVTFKKTWSGHEFTADEAMKLLAGESIAIGAISSKKKKAFRCEGRLEKRKYKGKSFWGFNSEKFL